MDETARRRADSLNKLQRTQPRLKIRSAAPLSAVGKDAVCPLAQALETTPPRPSRLRRCPEAPPAAAPKLERGRADAVVHAGPRRGGTTLIADEPAPARSNLAGSPKWSHDGTRIVFDATPGRDRLARLMMLEIRDGRPTFTDLGPGNCPTFSRDDKRIAFLLNPGARARGRGGRLGDAGRWLGATAGER